MASHTSLHSGYGNNVLRTWQSRTAKVNPDCLIYPIFVSANPDDYVEIKSLAGQYRLGKNHLVKHLTPMLENGLKTVLLFAVMEDVEKDFGGAILSTMNPIYDALRLLKEAFPSVVLACDVCLCAYTEHGHCYRMKDEEPDMELTLELITQAAEKYFECGADIIAPSDMMDGRILSITKKFKEIGKRHKVTVMSYSAKFASCFYGPFRDAALSTPKFGDRRNYQLPPGSSGLANRAVSRDIEEGADIIMVKPGMPCLDIVKDIKIKHPDHPIAVYQVSGEYAMLYHASQNGAFELKKAVMESLECFHRAGADIIVSYFTPDILKWLKSENEK